MRVYEKQLLDKRLKDFMEEVLPLDLLPYLSCLQKTDKEAVEAVQNNTGATRAVCMLVDRLKRRDKGFTQFVLALRKCGSAHTALLLDPYEHVEDTEDEAADTEDESELGFKKIGTVIDVKISGNILPKHGEEQSDNCREVEKYVAETYETPLSENSKRMRKELQQHLPIGAVFVHTEKGSIISTFRLSSASAANEFWAMYKEGKLQLMLQTELVDRTLQENEKTPEEQLTLKVNLGEEKFKKIQKTLADIESDQEIKESGSWLSSPIRKEGETADEDESALEIEIDIPPVFLENGNPLGSPELVLRDYQQELAHPALQGKNTIICAPTNSGKTYVAIEIARNHLESFSMNQDTCGPPDTRKEPRVVFIVSTVNLVLQQKERFELFLGDKYSVSEISGANATEIPLKYLLQSHKVVIMTAQILVNALNAPDREQRVQLNDMSLLIFDECHHAHKEHSYNRVMEKYLALKMQPGKEHRLPQIVGLTASLGTGKAKTAQKAEEHIILVCANLDAEVVSTVRNHQSELEKFVNVPKRAVFQVAKNDQDPFERIINQVMDKIHEGTKGLLGKFYKVPPPEKGGQQYRQWVEELYKDSVADGHRYLVTYAEHLRVYHIALTINKNTRMKNAKLHLQKYFDSLDKDRFTEIDQKLKSMFFRAMQVLSKFVQEHGEPQNPRLVRLEELLLDHHKNGATQEEKEQKEDDAKNTSKAEDLGQTEVETAPVDENQTENKEIKAGEEFQEPGETSEEGEGEGSASEKNVAAQEEKERKEDPPDDKKNISKAEDLGQTDVETASVAGNQPKNKEIKAGEEFQEPGDTSEEGEDMGRNGGSGSEEDPFQNNQESAEETEEVNHSDVQSAGEEASTTEEEDREETSGSSTDESQETKHIANEKPGPKGILFTRTRDSTEALLDWIKETDELNIVLRPEALVGSGDGTIGMTQHEQEQVIKRFKTGEKNLLLATSVAEEGLDISDCNYVIRYDMMGNEISSVQSRGRVRADEGKYSVVVSTESGAGKRELTNRFRECLMIEALSKVQSMDPKTFIIKVRTIQRTTSQDRFLKKQVVACRKSADLPDDVNFRCRKCNNIACQASDIRRIKDNYHVVINRNFRDSEVVLEPLSKPKKIDDVLMAKKIYCHKCKEDFGVTALINSVEWMCIKVRSFVLEFSDKDPSRRMYRKWKDVPFSIREATVDELLKQATDQGGAEFDSDDFNLD